MCSHNMKITTKQKSGVVSHEDAEYSEVMDSEVCEYHVEMQKVQEKQDETQRSMNEYTKKNKKIKKSQFKEDEGKENFTTKLMI